MNITLLSATLALSLTNIGKPPDLGRMSFTDVKISTVLQVIARQTGTNIVYVPHRVMVTTTSDGEKETKTESRRDEPRVTLDAYETTLENAIRDVTASAGLVYRKVRSTYVVAESEDLPGALARYYAPAMKFQMPPGVASAILRTIQDAFPNSVVIISRDDLVFTGLPEDSAIARGLIQELRLREIQLETENYPVSEVVPISHSNPADVAKAVSGMYPGLKVASAGGEKSGALTLSGPRHLIAAAAQFAREIDATVMNSPDNEFRVYEIKYLSATKLEAFMKSAMQDVDAFVAPETYSPKRAQFSPLTTAISANAVGGGTSASGGLGGSSNGGQGSGGGTSGSNNANSQEEKDARARRLVLRGSPGQLDAAMRLLASVDIKPQQIYVEVKVVETNPSFEQKLGLDWSWSPLQFFEVPKGTGIAKDPDTGLYDLNSAKTRPGGAGFFSRAPFSFASILNARIVSGEAKLLANPKVGVLDNDGASIFIGDTIRAQVSQSNGLGGQTIQIEEFPVGIILLIHPRINVDGNITMHVNPVVSTVTAITSGIPQTSSREAETTMIVKDGETIVLGGLIQDSYSKTLTAVPFLSKIPIIGELFKNRSTSKKRTDVIITITPHIMKEPVAGK